jgi:prepilin peptidase CpaA
MGWESIMLGGLSVVLAGLLLSAGLEDVRVREIANWKNAAVAALAPFWWWALGYSLWPDVPVQIGTALAVLGLFLVAFQLGLMGGGDVKLIAALALWFPFAAFAQFLVVMSIAGGVVTLALLAERRWRGRPEGGGEIEVPYGVAIAIAGLLTINEPILNQIA